MKFLSIKSLQREEFIDITNLLQRIVDESNIKEGICFVFVPHTTAGVTVNEGYDSSVKSDILRKLSQLVPLNGNYSHSEGNSDAHIKASLMGSSVCLPISNGKLSLGTWQKVFFCEFDGPRTRMVQVKLIQG